MKGYIVYNTYDIIEDQTNVILYGRLESGESFVTVNKIDHYFFIKQSDFEKAKKYLSKFDTHKTSLKTFHEDQVIKISSKNHIELNKLSSALHKLSIDTYESDIKPHNRFLMDNDILGTIEITGDSTSSEKIDRIFYNPEIKPSNFKPKLKIASIDIESDQDLYCIGIYSENYQKNFMITKHKLDNTVSCEDEYDCLEKFKQELISLDPDIITGWNLIDFDLKELQERFKRNKIKTDLGRGNENLRLRIENNFFKSSTADLSGRQIIDGLTFIKDPFIKEAPSIKFADFDSYTLEDVSQKILGKGKLIKGKSRHFELNDLYEKNTKDSHQKLVDYNLMDCKLAYEILEKTKMIDLAIERSQLTGMPLDKITASIAAFDSLYIREARKRGLVSPTTRYSEKEEKIKGGYVKEASPGIYHNILVLDFKSLYPSILRTFNIDPASLLDKNYPEAIESPNHAYFKNQDGILPEIIDRLHKARELAKKEKRELSSYAIKIIMNSFWGVLASPNCRYFNMDMANAITGFARFIIQLTAEEVESSFKTKVLYQDTDSCFVISDQEKEKANELGIKIQDHINQFYKEYVKANYNRQSYLELQFEKQYLAFMIPALRSKDSEEKGAKKRYAGIIEKNGKEELQVVGLEAIRGDWTEAAKDFQKELLIKVFHKKEVAEFIKDYIKKLNDGKIDDKLVYKKSIRKNLDEYTKTTPPHVKAARLLDTLDSNTIEYYITESGPEPIQKLKHKIDYNHYLKKQIEPIANQILSLFNKNLEDYLKRSKQSTLF